MIKKSRYYKPRLKSKRIKLELFRRRSLFSQEEVLLAGCTACGGSLGQCVPLVGCIP